MDKPFSNPMSERWREIVMKAAEKGTIPPDYRAYLAMLDEGVVSDKILKDALSGAYTAPEAGYENNSRYTDRNEPEISAMEKFYKKMLGGIYPKPKARSDY